MAILRPLVNALGALGGAKAAQGAQVSGGLEAELLFSKIHGDYGARAKNGQLFIASTAAAGVTIPVNAASLVSVFTFFNPTNSGVDMELLTLKISPAGTTTAVIGDLLLCYQTAGAALATLTNGPVPQNGLLGNGPASKVNFYTAATYTGTPVVADTLGIGWGTTGDAPGPVTGIVDFKGGIIVSPGTSITVAGNVAQTQPNGLSLWWLELPH